MLNTITQKPQNMEGVTGGYLSFISLGKSGSECVLLTLDIL